MSRLGKATLIALLALVTMAPVASARRGPYGPRDGYGWWGGPGWYGPGWYDPYWGPPYVPVPNTGNVKIDTQMKDASVYIDGGYAGLAGKLKKIPLKPGTHDVELRDPDGRTFYQENVEVIAGETTDVQANYAG